MVDNKEVMARNIRYYMSLHNLNSQDMCRIFDFKQPTFSDWINAKSYPRIDKIERMANYFGISKSRLVEEHIVGTGDDRFEAEIDYYVTNFSSEQKKRLIEYAKFLSQQEGDKHDDQRT